MKKTFLFCTKIWFYLAEIPPLFLMAVAIHFNEDAEGAGLYPLIIFCAAAAVLIFVYFFRMIIISKEEIRSAGVFSSRDCAVIEKNTSLTFTILPRKKIRVELDGIAKSSGLSWATREEGEDTQINLYREMAIGKGTAISRVLTYFGVSSKDCSTLLAESGVELTYDYFVASSLESDGVKKIKLQFTKTI